MEPLTIENPYKVVDYNMPWEKVKEHVLNVATHFQKENKLITQEPDNITILKLPLVATQNVNDQLLYISPIDKTDITSAVKFEMTNQKGKIESFNEQQLLINYIEVFTKLVDMSIENRLTSTVNALNRNAPNAQLSQGMIQLVLLVVAVVQFS